MRASKVGSREEVKIEEAVKKVSEKNVDRVFRSGEIPQEHAGGRVMLLNLANGRNNV
jgi:hypothetical protein